MTEQDTGAALAVDFTEDASSALYRAKAFLASRPAEHNLVHTLLVARATAQVPGRYWLVSRPNAVVGVVFQSPLHFPVLITPMGREAATAAARAIADQGLDLPGVSGDAAAAARFASAWAERMKTAVRPFRALCLYELERLESLALTADSSGHFRRAVDAEVELVGRWWGAFNHEIAEPADDMTEAARHRIARGEVWVWVSGAPVAMAMHSAPAAGVARIQYVYTPPELRQRGHASACVAKLSEHLLGRGLRPILYAELANPASNSIYRRLGYRPIGEATAYRFGAHGTP